MKRIASSAVACMFSRAPRSCWDDASLSRALSCLRCTTRQCTPIASLAPSMTAAKESVVRSVSRDVKSLHHCRLCDPLLSFSFWLRRTSTVFTQAGNFKRKRRATPARYPNLRVPRRHLCGNCSFTRALWLCGCAGAPKNVKHVPIEKYLKTELCVLGVALRLCWSPENNKACSDGIK